MNMKKKKIIAISIACLIAAGAVVAWLAYPRRVVVGFANTPEFMYSRIAQSADAENVEIRKVKNVKEYADCDAVFTFGMGLDWGEEERAAVQKLMDKGLKHMTLMAPNADNNISNLDSTQQNTFLEFFDNGGTAPPLAKLSAMVAMCSSPKIPTTSRSTPSRSTKPTTGSTA